MLLIFESFLCQFPCVRECCPSLMQTNIISSRKLNINLSPSKGYSGFLLHSQIRITSQTPNMSDILMSLAVGIVCMIFSAIMCYFYCFIRETQKRSLVICMLFNIVTTTAGITLLHNKRSDIRLHPLLAQLRLKSYIVARLVHSNFK